MCIRTKENYLELTTTVSSEENSLFIGNVILSRSFASECEQVRTDERELDRVHRLTLIRRQILHTHCGKTEQI